MKKTILSILMACLLLTAMPVMAFAEEGEAVLREPGQCGEDLTWSYHGGTLTISGSGEMDDYPDGDAPWLEYRNSITKVVFSGNVTSVGAGAFLDYDEITSVDFGNAMHTIGSQAFKSCDGLTVIYLPATFRKFGEESFMNCKSLTEVRCRGGMPSFKGNCLWDTYCTVFYPTNNPWPSEPVMQLFQAFHGRINFFMASESELIPPQTSEPETQAATEPATEPATQPTTEPATQPTETQPPVTETTLPETTVPATEAEETTQPTQPATEESTQPVEETVPETQPAKKGKLRGLTMGLILISGTLSFVLIGALIFRRRY